MANTTWYDTNGAPVNGNANKPTYGYRYKTTINPDVYIKDYGVYQPKSSASITPVTAPATAQAVSANNTTYVPSPAAASSGSTSAYASAADAQLAASLEPIRAQMQINQREYDLAKQRLADNRDEAMRQAYIESRMQQRNLPQQLARTGYNGGLTETTMAGLANTYMNNRNALELQHADDLADLDFEKYKSDTELNAMIAQAQAEAEAARLSAASSGSYSSSDNSDSGGSVGLSKNKGKGTINRSSSYESALIPFVEAKYRSGASDQQIADALNKYLK